MPNRVKVDFSWSPVGSVLSYTVNGNTYPYSRQQDNIDRSARVGALDSRYAANTTSSGVLLTFTAAVTLPSGVVVTEYRWEWGDGTVGFGASATHTYKVAAPETQVNLVITDSLRNRYSKSKLLNLR